MSDTLSGEWASYRERVIPPEVEWERVLQAKDAFYGGALAITMLMMQKASKPSTDEKEVEYLIDELIGYIDQRTKELL